MDKTKLIVVFGYSGAGKSYFCDRAAQLAGFTHIHAIGHIKKQYEKLYRLPSGCLDTPEGKKTILPGTNITGGQLLLDLYHFWSERDPKYSIRGLRLILDKHFSTGKSVALNAIRNESEVDLILWFIAKYKLDTTVVWLSSDRAHCKSSDLLQTQLYTSLRNTKKITVVNTYKAGYLDNIITTINNG